MMCDDIGPANISVSPNGKHIGVVWSETKDLAIFTQYSSEAWNQTYQGLGSAIVWSSDAKHLAILHHPQVATPLRPIPNYLDFL